MAIPPLTPLAGGSHCDGIRCDHDEDAAPRASVALPRRGRHVLAARRVRLDPGQSRRPTLSTRTTATPSSADASRSTSAVMPQS
jgi:hypothetical protein